MSYYFSSVESAVFGGSSGKRFENDLYNVFRRNDKKTMLKTGTDMDIKEGTDLIYNGVHIDATTNFSSKKYMPYIMDTGIEVLPGENLKIGIRHGNKHHGYTGFKKPVVVIGMDCPPGSTYNTYEDEIFDVIQEHASEIAYDAADMYIIYMTKDLEDKQTYETKPIKANPNYRQPRNIEKRYRELNELQSLVLSEGSDDQPDY